MLLRLLGVLTAIFAAGVHGTKPEKRDYLYQQPEQVHIAFGEATNEIVVTWSTMNDTARSTVEYGIGNMDQTAYGYSTKFVDGGKKKHFQYIHRVTLRDLQYDTNYVYHCGSEDGISDKFSFKTPPSGTNWTLRAAIYGDMGNINAQSLTYLQEESQRGMYDMILHVGDFAYDMDTEDATVGDQFMRQLEPLAAYLPYMTCPGNHEEKYNFSNYKNRFSMPGGYESMMYSFDIGPVHFISISTEFYYFLNYGMKQLVKQYEWLVEDLKKASDVENRAKIPWIILYGHRPMYCSNDNTDDCRNHGTMTRVGPGHLFVNRPWIILYGHRPMYCSNKDDQDDCEDEFTRVGIPFLHWFGIEKLLYEYGVDIVIWAHEHSYERTWPLYDYQVYNGSLEEPYRNPKAPIHIVTGSAGCQEGRDPFIRNTEPWSAFHSNDYGYTRFKAYNFTHIHMEQVSVDQKGKIIDEFWVIKDHHDSFVKMN